MKVQYHYSVTSPEDIRSLALLGRSCHKREIGTKTLMCLPHLVLFLLYIQITFIGQTSSWR